MANVQLACMFTSFTHSREVSMRSIIATVVGALSLTIGSAFLAPAVANATPPGTTHVVPSMTSCQQYDTQSNVECATSYTEQFLAAFNVSDAVRETVLVPSWSLGVWPSEISLCGFIDTPIYGMGAHHCDHTTFIQLEQPLDKKMMSNRAHSIAVLAHESAHGVQEAAGQDPVTLTLTNQYDRLLKLEQSADCWSGVAIRWYINHGMLPASAHQSVNEFYGDIGSPNDPGHGTGPMRQDAFEKGFYSGTSACNVIVSGNVFPVS